MKKFLGCGLLFLMFLQFGYGFEEDSFVKESVFKINSTFNTLRISAMGGSGVSLPVNIESLLYNPAGLSAKINNRKKSFSINVYGETYFRPQYLFPILSSISSSKNDVEKVLLNFKELVTTSGVGGDFTFAAGITPQNQNWGLGAYGGFVVYANGKPFPLGTNGFLQMDLSLPLGCSWKSFSNSKESLDVGLLIRPNVVIFKDLSGSDIDALSGGSVTINDLISEALKSPYFSLPIDIGLIYTVYDVPYQFAEFRFAAVLKNILGEYFGPGIKLQKIEQTSLFNCGIGLIFPFNLFSIKNSIMLTVELHGINQFFTGYSDFWKALRLGGELSIGNKVFIRGGLTSGYPSFGMEVNFYIFSFGFSWQTIERGLYIGDNPLSVFKISIAIK